MRLAYPSLALALALGALSAARATPPGPSPRGPTDHHKSAAHHDAPKPAHADHHNGQGGQGHHQDGHAGHTDQHQTGQHHPDHPHHHHHHHPAHHDQDGHANGGQKGASFQGMVVKVHVDADGKCGRVWARDGRGQVQMFHVSNSTQLGGKSTQGLKGLTAGSTVCVHANQQKATQVQVNGLAPSGGASGGQGTFSGRVVSAHRDRDGDHGSLAVQASHGGPTKRFKVSGATHVCHEASGQSGGQKQKPFVQAGQSVTVHSHGGLALQIDVHGHSGGPTQSGSSTVASAQHHSK
jgi:hypothetical protein